MTKKKKRKLLFVTQDWVDYSSFLDELIDSLALFDVFLDKDPFYNNQEGIGYIISKTPLSKKLIKTLSKKHHNSASGFEL